jgi:ribosomal 30S subunit maturation factor RimM
MKLNIPKDQLLNPVPTRVFLCTTGKKRMYELQAVNRKLNAKWSQYSEFSFEIQRTYVDMLTGETKVHPAYDKVEAPRNIFVEGLSYFSLQDIDDTSSDNDIKSVSSFSVEYAASNKYLTNWHINTGEVDSKEVLYNETQYGIDYNTDMDSFYKLASDDFDPYESYYQQVYTDTDSYTYEQVQIDDAAEYAELIKANNISDAQPHERLYMKKFPNVQFYNNNPSKRELSLLHLIFENIPEWQIGDVDQSLWRKERKFSEDRISVYDFIQNNLSDTFGCVAVWDSLSGKVHFYEELEDDSNIENEINTKFETDVFISKDNLASEVKVSYSSDNIKTKLVVTGSDDLNIREVNLGRNEIMDLSFYHTEEWMEPDLFEAYSDYLVALQEAQIGLTSDGFPSANYPISYPDAMKGWVSANNRWNDLMNEVPAEGNVVFVGDEFKRLYCSFSPVNNAYSKITIGSGTEYVETKDLYLDEAFMNPIPTPANSDTYVVQGALLVYSTTDKMFKVDTEWSIKKSALIKKLNQYHIDEDIEANKQDNILLRLKNTASDIATIRIYDRRREVTEYEDNVKYYVKNTDGTWRKEPEPIKNGVEFNDAKITYGNRLYTNDYYIQSMITYASSGKNGDAKQYPIINWIKGDLTADSMGLNGYKVSYIGTMGAYFVLAKDETMPENLQDYGVRLLQEKHKNYTTIFQTQTEAMFSQEKAQCIVQDETPKGDYKQGTRWLDTDSSPVELKEYNGTSWVTISASVSQTDQVDYENYQRYIDNYEKLVAVQSVLSSKKREAEYCLNGYAIPNRVIVMRPTDGSSLDENMYNAALSHFNGHTVTRQSLNTVYPLYTFTTSFDPIVYGKNTKPYNPVETYYIKNNTAEIYTPVKIENKDKFDTYDGTTNDKTLYVVTSGHMFAVYLKGTTPYVAYANSQGVYQMIKEYIRDKTEMNKFFTVDQWIRLSPLIKEDEFNDPNFLLTGYESEEERIKICQELMEAADKELKTLCKPSLEFSMTMANILALPEFEPLFNQFQLGNFIKVGIRDGYVKRSRLLEVNMNFDDLSDFSCTFGNLVTTKSEIDKHADLLKTAVTAGKQVAKSSGSWQKSVDKTNKLEQDIANGLQDMTLAVGSASGQAISWDSTGMHFRKYRDGSTTEYEPEEMAIINNSLVATNDSWRTSKAAFGKYTINGEDRWGPIAEYVTADVIEGKRISGGAIEIGSGDTKFIVNEDGSVEIRSGGTNYVNAMTEINNAYSFSTVLTYNGLTIFSDTSHECTVTCEVYHYKDLITSDVISNGATFTWKRTSNEPSEDINWKPTYVDGQSNVIKVKVGDIIKNSQIYCEVNFDETKFTKDNKT